MFIGAKIGRICPIRPISLHPLRHHGTHLLPPGFEIGGKLGFDVWVFLAEVLLFSEILGEVVELGIAVFPEFDEFPVAFANSSAGSPAGTMIVRIMPV